MVAGVQSCECMLVQTQVWEWLGWLNRWLRVRW